eukprot:28484_1
MCKTLPSRSCVACSGRRSKQGTTSSAMRAPRRACRSFRRRSAVFPSMSSPTPPPSSMSWLTARLWARSDSPCPTPTSTTSMRRALRSFGSATTTS